MASHKRQALILALLQSPSLRAAARRAEVTYRTAVRWHAEPDFQKELESAKREAFGHALAVLHGTSAHAAVALAKNLKSDKASDRNTAARALLDLAFQGHAALDLRAKLAELEQLIRGRSDAQPERDAQEGRRAAGRGTRRRR
jgi:hypothetical protein